MRIAVIDVGSNSIHMVVAQLEADGRFHVLDRAKEMVRLGSGTLIKGRLTKEAFHAGLTTLAAFHTLALRLGAQRFKVVATCALREASNGTEFIRQVQERLGIRIKVIPGREEARLVYLGVNHAIDLRKEPTLIVDVGGGSVELIPTEDGSPISFHSLKIGVSRLTERFFSHDPPTPKEVRRLDSHLAEELDPVLAAMAGRNVRRVVGTSGTMLNLIAMAGHLRGEPPGVHLNHFTVGAGDITHLRRLLADSDREHRAQLKGLDAKRVDLIVAGVHLADYVLRELGAREVVACTWALREGVLLDFIARHRKGIEEVERFSDPRRRSVARLARHLGEIGNHGPQVARLAVRLFDQLAAGLRLLPEARDWLEYAALLHDVGHHISHHNHQAHSYYLITNGDLLGFRRDEIEIIGQVARYHRKGTPKASDPAHAVLPAPLRRTVRRLVALLRVADGLDRSHYGVVRDIDVSRRGDRLLLRVHTDGEDAVLEINEARERAKLLERFLGLTLDFKTASAKPAATPLGSQATAAGQRVRVAR